jgi:hypothetical protein
MPSTVTNRLQGLTTSVAVKPPCITVATSNITLAGLQTISSVTVEEGDRVLVKGQSDATKNGIYAASTGNWARSKDFDGELDVVQGTRVLVRNTGIDGVEYELTTPNPIVIGTTELTFVLRYGANATYDQTEAEIAASVTPTDYSVPSHDVVGVIYPRRYGFSVSASSSVNAAALQAAADVAEAATTTKTYSGDGYGANTHTLPEISLGAGVYSIDADIEMPRAIIIRGEKTILVQETAGQDHFSFANPYRVDIEGVVFKDGRHAIFGDGANTNTSRIRIARCEFHTANASEYALYFDVTTLNLLIEDCWVMDSPLFLDTDGDFIEINSCWINGYKQSTGLKPDNTASINNRGRYMRIRGGSWVPQVDGIGLSTDTRWINNRGGLLAIEDVQFGGENAGLPIVYEYGSAVSGGFPFMQLNGTIIRGCQLAQGHDSLTNRGVVVLRGAVPSLIDIRGGMYVVNGKIVSDAGFSSPTLQEWLNANIPGTGNKIRIIIEDVTEEVSTYVPDPLLPFSRITKRPRGNVPGSNYLGVINTPIIEYLPHWQNTQARASSAVAGQKRDPASSTYFDAIIVAKAANDANGSAAAVITVDAVAVGEVSGPAGFVSQAQFRITLLASRSGNIRSVVETVTQNNLDSSGGTSVGNVLTCQVTGTSTTTVTIQLRINTTITAGVSAVMWNARLASVANANSTSLGRVFSMASA